MLNMFWNYASPIRKSIPQDQPTDFVNNNYSYENENGVLNFRGILFIKTKNSCIQQISDDCLIDINQINGFYMKIKYNGMETIIDKEVKLFKFNDSFDNKYIMWQNNSNHYILELFQEKPKKKNPFLKNISSTTCTPPNKIFKSFETKAHSKEKMVTNIGMINNINSFLENLVKTKEKSNYSKNNYSHINNNEIIIDKEEFKKNFDEYKEIYINKGTAFRYDNILEEVIPFRDSDNQNIQSFIKVNYIGDKTYILVLEQNNKIIAFIKIWHENDISINENSGTISFLYMDKNTENHSYIFSFEEKSYNEMKFFKNLIMRCLYEKNNCFYDLSYIQDFSNCDSMELNSYFDKEFDFDKSSLFSSKSLKNNSQNFFFLDSDVKNNDFKSSFQNMDDTNNIINFELFQDNEGIRLFNGKGETIKIIITGNKSPIRNIDISNNKKYFLISCDKYLVLISTDNTNNSNNNNESPFNYIKKSFKSLKEPIILRISRNDLIKYNIINESFNNAKFAVNENTNESMILSSLGQYIIIWNFDKVLEGDINCYQIINSSVL